MKFSYEPLRYKLAQWQMSYAELGRRCNLAAGTRVKLAHDEVVNFDILVRIGQELKLPIQDIAEIIFTEDEVNGTERVVNGEKRENTGAPRITVEQLLNYFDSSSELIQIVDPLTGSWDHYAEFPSDSCLLDPFLHFTIDSIGAVSEDVIRISIENKKNATT